ncbi:MAG: hypothetical protein PUB35_07430 [Campylobacteraceae bacterium]|nr:hypothetical protein [Campylobacteraceae bacterium]
MKGLMMSVELCKILKEISKNKIKLDSLNMKKNSLQVEYEIASKRLNSKYKKDIEKIEQKINLINQEISHYFKNSENLRSELGTDIS